MNKTPLSNSDVKSEPTVRTHGKLLKAVRIAVWSLGGLLAAVILALCAITWYLTPERLSKLLSKEMSEYLDADVTVQNARFTFWSTFPRFTLETDSIIIVSRTLDDLPESELKRLPGNPKILATASSLEGGINIIQLLRGRYVMHDLDVNSLHLNLVTVNDSVNNYDIVPRHREDDDKIHFFTTNSLKLTDPEGIDIYFAESDTKAHVDLENAVMTREKGESDYDLSLRGKVTASTGALFIFHEFPFYLHGNVDLGFEPFKLQFKNFAIDLESIRSELDMTLDLQGDMTVNNLDYRISMVNFRKLFKALPWLPLGDLKSIDMDLDVRLSARLDRPYVFSSGKLPYLTVSAGIEGNTFDYKASDGRTIPLTFSSLTAGLNLNGDNPGKSTLFLEPFTISAEESSLTLSARISDVLASPLVDISFSGGSNLDYISRRYPELQKWEMEGLVSFSGNASGYLETLSLSAVEKGLNRLQFAADIKADSLKCNIDGYDFNAATLDVRLASRGFSPDPRYPLDMPVDISARATDALLETPGGISYISPDITASTSVSGGESIRDFRLAPVELDATHFTLGFGDDNRVVLHDATGALGEVAARRYLPGAAVSPSTHYLAVKAPKGELHAAFSKLANPLTNIDIYYNPDSISINSLGIRCLSSYADIKGKVVNLRDFIHSGMKAPLKVNLDIACDTIDINQIAHTYYKGNRKGDAVSAAKQEEEDTTPILIPRNITADINVRAKESIYTNLHLFDLGGGIHIKDGVARITDFGIRADFGHALLGLVYDTSDLQKMRVGLEASLVDINVENFFKNFHTLLLMMPQMSNLKGMVTLAVSGGLELFPNMYINMPSLHADINFKGWDLTLHQNHFIHRLASKLLIRGDRDLHIANLDVNVKVKDNLMEVFPFDFDMENYHLRAEGTNNFNGDLYYHIDVQKSPVPFPFGINIEGKFHDPKIRFGRARYDVRKGEEITLEDEVYSHMNLVREVKYYIKEFIRKAAESKDQ